MANKMAHNRGSGKRKTRSDKGKKRGPYKGAKKTVKQKMKEMKIRKMNERRRKRGERPIKLRD